MPKRLFDRRSIDTLLAAGWEIIAADEHASHRYGGEKVAWEVAARKAEG